MKLNKILKVLSVAGLAVLVSVSIADANTQSAINMGALCKEMGNIFKLLRNLAFIGAAFVIAGWAWGFISGGKAELKDAKEKGIGLLVGFILLAITGIAMGALGSNCAAQFTGLN